MSFTDFITNHGKRVNKQAFIHLVQVSRIDGRIHKDELELLHREGKKFGLTEPEIENLINEENNTSYHSPYSLEEKFEHIYNMAEMILADGEVTEKEKKMMRKFAIEVGLKDSRIEKVIELLIEGIEKNSDEEMLLKKFKNTILH